jgi:hypothetical protein
MFSAVFAALWSLGAILFWLWGRHDEATTHYVDMIDQTTLGHAFLMEEFGAIPRIGWQIGTNSVCTPFVACASLGESAVWRVAPWIRSFRTFRYASRFGS